MIRYFDGFSRINLVLHYADQLLVVSYGVVIAQGPSDDVVTCKNMQKVFSIDVNVIVYPKTYRPIIV